MCDISSLCSFWCPREHLRIPQGVIPELVIVVMTSGEVRWWSGCQNDDEDLEDSVKKHHGDAESA